MKLACIRSTRLATASDTVTAFSPFFFATAMVTAGISPSPSLARGSPAAKAKRLRCMISSRGPSDTVATSPILIENGRASGGERGWQYVEVLGVGGSLNNKK